jgi:hypothetical protein
MVTHRDKAGREAARLSLIVSPQLRKKIERVAKKEKRTLVAQCALLLEKGLEASAAA